MSTPYHQRAIQSSLQQDKELPGYLLASSFTVPEARAFLTLLLKLLPPEPPSEPQASAMAAAHWNIAPRARKALTWRYSHDSSLGNLALSYCFQQDPKRFLRPLKVGVPLDGGAHAGLWHYLLYCQLLHHLGEEGVVLWRGENPPKLTLHQWFRLLTEQEDLLRADKPLSWRLPLLSVAAEHLKDSAPTLDSGEEAL